jgi:vancomycin aglycone glucosyltransferase
MRVLLSTFGSRGDVRPLVALALQLKARAHDVHLCVPPDFRDWIVSLGIAATPMGPEVRKLAAARTSTPTPPPRSTPEQRHQAIEAMVAAQFETITARAQRCDIIVGATAQQVVARSIAERLGIAYVFAAYAPTVLPSEHHSPPGLPTGPGQPALSTSDLRELWVLDTLRFHNLYGGAVNAHRASLGLAPVSDVRSHMFTDRPWLAADPVLAPWPDRAADVLQTGAWILPDDRPLPRELNAFLDSGEPPIYFGFGSTRAPQNAGPVMLQAARALKRRVIMSRDWFEGSLGDDQADCLVIGEVNLDALFRRVTAVVHHGGAGTTTAAALAGAPQVLIPHLYDQYYWAQQVRRLGIGTGLARGALSAESLTLALEQTLKPRVVARAKSVAGRVRRDGVQRAARQLERYVAKSRAVSAVE